MDVEMIKRELDDIRREVWGFPVAAEDAIELLSAFRTVEREFGVGDQPPKFWGSEWTR